MTVEMKRTYRINTCIDFCENNYLRILDKFIAWISIYPLCLNVKYGSFKCLRITVIIKHGFILFRRLELMSHLLAGAYVFCCWIKEFALQKNLEIWISLQSSLQIHRDSPVVQITRKTRLESIPPIQTMAVSRYCVHVHVCIPWKQEENDWSLLCIFTVNE